MNIRIKFRQAPCLPCLCLFITLPLYISLAAQKPVIDSAIARHLHWGPVDQGRLSSDGKYVRYVINNEGNKTVLVVQAVNGNWRKEFTQVQNAEFSYDGRYVIFKNDGDSLLLQPLGLKEATVTQNVKDWQLIRSNNTEYLAYTTNSSKGEWLARDLGGNKTFTFLSDYTINIVVPDKNALLLHRTFSSTKKTTLAWLDLSSGEEKVIWQGKEHGVFTFSPEGSRLAFYGTRDSLSGLSLWSYNMGDDTAKELANGNSSQPDTTLQLFDSQLQFSQDRKKIFFSLREKPSERTVPVTGVMVDVWNHKDIKLQSEQLQQLHRRPDPYLCVADITTGIIKKIQMPGEQISSGSSEFVMVMKKVEEKTEIYARSLSNGTDTYLYKGYIGGFQFSPDGRFAVGFDQWQKCWYVFDEKNKQFQKLSGHIPYPVYNENAYDYAGLPPYSRVNRVDAIEWIGNSTYALVYDNFDIWKVDMANPSVAVNITKGYGRTHHIKFRIAWEESQNNKPRLVHEKDTLLLSGFNKATKANGFFSTVLNGNAPPVKRSMEPVIVYVTMSQVDISGPKEDFLQKAANAPVWLVKRQTEKEAPNYFITTDFRTFSALTTIQPQKDYNWYTTELIHYPLANGKTGTGVLYKPEDFDAGKKYPVIFTYYEKYSDNLHSFIHPELSSDQVNIPYFVSKGYLVFVPDIFYEPGNPGISAANYVNAAAKYLTQYSFVDAKHMGIQGHSFGGYETNFIVTHSDLFAAAAESAGKSDLISGYGTLRLGINGFGTSSHDYYESSQGRMKYTPWQRRDLYINNSPVFFADKVSAPVLILHNLKDGNVPFEQGVEFFTALQRLNKPVWMLQYTDGSHGIDGEESKLDYTKRLLQFFDHYLKEAPAPTWMTRGIPATLRGIETGYEPDTAGKCSDTCPVCRKWNKKNNN